MLPILCQKPGIVDKSKRSLQDRGFSLEIKTDLRNITKKLYYQAGFIFKPALLLNPAILLPLHTYLKQKSGR